MDPLYALQQILNGLQLGAIYALLALGYTMVYGIIRLVNFAHGDFFMVGAYAAYGCFFLAGWRAGPAQVLALSLAAMGGGAAAAVLANRFAYRPLRNRPRYAALVTTIGVSLLLEYTFSALPMIGPSPRAFPEILPHHAAALGRLRVSGCLVLDLAVVGALMVGLLLLVHRSPAGRAMRAVAQDPEASRLMGIDVERVITWTFLVGGALAGAAGVLAGTTYPSIHPYMGVMPGLKAFVAAVLGGIGSIPGAVAGALVMGQVEVLASAIHSVLGEGIAFVVLVLVLLVRPDGLLGRKAQDKI